MNLKVLLETMKFLKRFKCLFSKSRRKDFLLSFSFSKISGQGTQRFVLEWGWSLSHGGKQANKSTSFGLIFFGHSKQYFFLLQYPNISTGSTVQKRFNWSRRKGAEIRGRVGSVQLIDWRFQSYFFWPWSGLTYFPVLNAKLGAVTL